MGNYALCYSGETLGFPQASAIDLKGMLILDRYFVRSIGKSIRYIVFVKQFLLWLE